MKKDKVVLAYSGGLDTSIILKWLVNKGFEVICFVGDVGQSDDFNLVKEKALKLGAKEVHIKDLQEEFIVDYIFPALQGNALYEGRYLLGTSLARPVLAKAQIEVAQKVDPKIVSHGSTGKGNDQVRFELSYYALAPDIEILAPWKNTEFLNQFKGRDDLLDYAREWNIPVAASKSNPYSEDENIMHISHEAGDLEDPETRPDESVFSLTNSIADSDENESLIEIYFNNGMPTQVKNIDDGETISGSLNLFKYLNELGKRHGIGRVDMVENRFIGIKSRGIYETPGATILWDAHRDLEGIAMDKEVMHIRDMLIPKFSELIYNGFWFSPEMDFLLTAINKSQEAVDGKVKLALIKGNVITIGRESPSSLYNKDLSSMNVEGGFDSTDSTGFININAIRLKAHNLIMKKINPYKWRKD